MFVAHTRSPAHDFYTDSMLLSLTPPNANASARRRTRYLNDCGEPSSGLSLSSLPLFLQDLGIATRPPNSNPLQLDLLILSSFLQSTPPQPLLSCPP